MVRRASRSGFCIAIGANCPFAENQASLPPRLAQRRIIVPNPYASSLLGLRLLAFALASALACPALAADSTDASSICPVGTLICPKKKSSYGLCRRNDLLDFFVAGL